MRIDRRGGEPIVVHRLDVAEPFAVWTPMHWLPDGTMIYAQTGVDPDQPGNRIWRVEVDGGKARKVVAGGLDDEIPLAAVAGVRSELASVYSVRRLAEAAFDVTAPVFWLADLTDGSTMAVPSIDLATGEPAVDDAESIDASTIAWPLTPIALSPDGTAGLIAYRAGEDLAFGTIDTASGEVTLLEQRTPFRPTPPVPTVWATNDTVLLLGAPGTATLLSLDAQPDSAAGRWLPSGRRWGRQGVICRPLFPGVRPGFHGVGGRVAARECRRHCGVITVRSRGRVAGLRPRRR